MWSLKSLPCLSAVISRRLSIPGGVAKLGRTTFPCPQQSENLKQSLVLVESFSLCQNLAEQCEQGKVIEPSERSSTILSSISHAGAARRIMKFFISITSDFGRILSLITQTESTSCFALKFILSNFVIQLTLETVSPFSSTLNLPECLLLLCLEFEACNPFISALAL